MNIDTITALVDQVADKDKVPIHCDGLWTFSTEELERFAALIERKVRGNAEPVAWSVFDKRTKKHWYVNESEYTAQHYAKEYSHREPDNTLSMVVVPLYTHPAPAVVRLTNKEIIDLYETSELAGSHFETGTEKAIAVAHAVMKAMEEKAAAKKAGL